MPRPWPGPPGCPAKVAQIDFGHFPQRSRGAHVSGTPRLKMVARTGIEPVTQGFSVLCSTN